MTRELSFIGIDLGGARGKTTAVARLVTGIDEVVVEEVSARHQETPFNDEALLEYLPSAGEVVIALNAPLTLPACIRCQLSHCPGQAACVDPAVVWLREAAELVETVAENLAVPSAATGQPPLGPRPRIVPYLHRCTEVELHYRRRLMGRDLMNKPTSVIAARASHLRRRLQGRGYRLNHDLIEVSPRLTVQVLFGSHRARGYKRDADPWETRAAIIEELADLRFAPISRLAREETLRNDHCFEAVLSGYTAFLRHRDRWLLPTGQESLLDIDGWIWVPPA